MKKIITLLTVLILSACSNLSNLDINSLTGKKVAIPNEISNTLSAKQYYTVGSDKLTDSGIIVAKENAKVDANKNLQKIVDRNVKKRLKVYLKEIDYFSKKLSNKVIKDLSKYTALSLRNDVKFKDGWTDEKGNYNVVAFIERSKVNEKTRKVFLNHLTDVMNNLEKAKGNIGNNFYLEREANKATLKKKVTSPKENFEEIEIELEEF